MFSIESHGTSGRWHQHTETYPNLDVAKKAARLIKNNGYGVRILDASGAVVVNAPWQVQVDDAEAYDFPNAKQPHTTPLAFGKGMTNAEVDDAWQAHLDHIANV